MKKTIKNTCAGLTLAALLSTAVFTGCQMACLDEGNGYAENSVENSLSRNIVETKTDSEKIDEIYKQVTKEKPYEYKGEKIAAARITEKLTEMIPVKDIEDPILNYLATVGVKAMDAGAQALDSYLNDFTCGFYGVFTSILWPENEGGVSGETQMILDRIDEVSKQIADLETNMDKNFNAQNRQRQIDKNERYLIDRKASLVKLRETFTNNAKITGWLEGTGSGIMPFVNYQQFISSLTGRDFLEGSLADISSKTKEFFALYDCSIGNNGNSYSDICSEYARAVSAWGYEYDNMLKTFANGEFMESIKLISILKAAYSPYIDGEVNYNHKIMTLLSFLANPKSSYYYDICNLLNGCIPAEDQKNYEFMYDNRTVTPNMIRDAKNNSKQLYEYLLAYLCKTGRYDSDEANDGKYKAFFPSNFVDIVIGGGDINDVDGMRKSDQDYRIGNLAAYMRAQKVAYENWEKIEESYLNYVDSVNGIYRKLVNDKLGYVTCMIPGVEETFLTSMGYVNYGKTIQSFLTCSWPGKPGWVNEAFHGAYVQGNFNGDAWRRRDTVKSDFTKNISHFIYGYGDDYNSLTTNTFQYLKKDSYKKIYEFYSNGNHKLYKSVPVTYADQNYNIIKVEIDTKADVINNPTLSEIFYYGAGIGYDMTCCLKASTGIKVAKPNDLNEGLKEDGRASNMYAYEEGAPSFTVEDEHSVVTPFSKWYGNWEYYIRSNGIYGNKRGEWSNEFAKSDWMLIKVPSKKNLSSVEDILWDAIGSDAVLYSDMTYVFPNVVHNMKWKTYWERNK